MLYFPWVSSFKTVGFKKLNSYCFGEAFDMFMPTITHPKVLSPATPPTRLKNHLVTGTWVMRPKHQSHPSDLFVSLPSKEKLQKTHSTQPSADRVSFYRGATERAKDALTSTDSVQVDLGHHRAAFIPKSPQKKGVIIYPGAVEHLAYACVGKGIAEKGYLAAVANTPLNVFGGNHDRASKIIQEFQDIDQWILVGHSFGGLIIDDYARRHPAQKKLGGLVYWGAFPVMNQSENDHLRMLVLRGTQEAMLEKYNGYNYKKNMPPHSPIQIIQGANHSYYADYGLSARDGKAEITREAQQEEVIRLTLAFLESLSTQA